MALFSKKPIIVISLGDDGAIISTFQEKVLVKRIFVTTPSSSDFMDLVKTYDSSPIYLLLDTIDQNYIFSNVPAIGRAGVNKVIERKITTEFDPNDINASLFLAKETGTKPTLKYLFVSIRNASPLKDWLAEIHNLPNKFMGIYLLPVEAEHFISQIRTVTHGELIPIPKEWEVLITYNRVGGFRQVVLRNGKLIFTRISQSVSLQTPDAIGKNISHEAANTLEYIRRIGFGDQSISVYAVCAKDVGNFIDIPGVKTKDIYAYSPFEVAQKLGYEQNAQEGDKFGDVIFATSFVTNEKKILRLLTPHTKAQYKKQIITRSIEYVSYLLFAVLPIASAYFLYGAVSNEAKISKDKGKLADKQTEFAAMKDFKKIYGISPEELADVIKTKKAVSDLDKAEFDTVALYRKTDIYSDGINTVNFDRTPNPTNPNGFTVAVIVGFVFDKTKSYSDVLYKMEQYTNAIKAAFPDYDVTFDGLPNDKDVQVNVDTDQLEKKYNVTAKIMTR